MDAILTLVNQYGLPLVILVAIGYTIYSVLKDSNYSISINAKTDSQYDKEHFEKMEKNMRLTAALKSLMQELNADRVSVYQYHNGGHNINGLGFAKVSCTHEEARQGLMKVDYQMRSLPIGAFLHWYDLTKDGSVVEYCDLEKMKEDDVTTYAYHANNSVAGMYSIGLVNSNGIAVGFINVYFNDSLDECLSDEDKVKIERNSFMISSLLE